MHNAKRYLGLDLAGAKNQKTALAALEHYPKENKTFLLDIYDRIHLSDAHPTNDDALLDTIAESLEGHTRLGVNATPDLPPCVTCTRKTCPMPGRCTVPAVKWMRDHIRRSTGAIHGREFTPYTQRPFEIWMRHHVMSRIPAEFRFEIDETLGGSKAPLTARMGFLKRHLGARWPELELIETWPKLTVAVLADGLGLSKRSVAAYRRLEEGAHSRALIIEALVEKEGVFIYERDQRKISENLPCFDAFICAFTALLSDTGRCSKMPKGFPAASGWVHYPTC